MALLWMDGLDYCRTTPYFSHPGSVYMNGSGGKFGGGKLMMSGTAPNFTKRLGAAIGNRVLFGCYFQTTNASAEVIRFGNVASGQFATINVASGKLAIGGWSNSGTIATGTRTVNDGAWHWIEFDITYAAASAGIVKVYVDGFSDYSNLAITSLASGTASVDYFTIPYPGASWTTYFDDIVWYDNTAGSLTGSSFPLGPRRIALLQPTADGTVQFSRSSGGTSYNLINENVPDGSSYVTAASGSLRDLYDVTNLSFTPASITTVQHSLLAVNAGTTNLGIRPVVKSSATVSVGSTYTPGVSYEYTSMELATDPDTAAAWTVSGIDAAQFGFESV